MVGRDAELELLERGARPRPARSGRASSFTLLGPAGRREVPARPGVPRRLGAAADRPARPVPVLRRGHHVLPARRGRPAGRRASPTATRRRRRSSEARRRSWRTPRTASAIAAARAQAHRAGGEPRRDRGRLLGASASSSRHLARDRPLVVVFDDIHWGEPTFLDLIEHIADWTRDAAILLLCVARPELLEIRPGWGGGKMNATSILLEPLAGDERVARWSTTCSGEPRSRRPARDRILEAAEGNPLFVEEMLGDADRRRPASVRGRLRGAPRATSRPHGPADDPAPAGRAAGPARRRGARGDRARRRRGQGVPPRRRDDAVARAAARERAARACSPSRARS